MYKNLLAEMARNKKEYKDIAKVIGKNKKSVGNKMLGITDWNRNEMFLIRNQLFPECTLEYLFEVETTE